MCPICRALKKHLKTMEPTYGFPIYASGYTDAVCEVIIKLNELNKRGKQNGKVRKAKAR